LSDAVAAERERPRAGADALVALVGVAVTAIRLSIFSTRVCQSPRASVDAHRQRTLADSGSPSTTR
jgi:hypothetical protein